MGDNFQASCKYCHVAIPVDAYFCPDCGKMLREKTTILRQIVVYFISLFVPPFGLLFAWRYLRQADGRSKRVGIAALVLTTVAVIISIWLSMSLINQVDRQLNEIGNLNIY